MNINDLLNKDIQMKLTDEMWITLGFQKYYHLGWKKQFEDDFTLFTMLDNDFDMTVYRATPLISFGIMLTLPTNSDRSI